MFKTSSLKLHFSMCKLLLDFAAAAINNVSLSLWSLSEDFFTIQGISFRFLICITHWTTTTSDWIHPPNIRKLKPYTANPDTLFNFYSTPNQLYTWLQHCNEKKKQRFKLSFSLLQITNCRKKVYAAESYKAKAKLKPELTIKVLWNRLKPELTIKGFWNTC